MFLRYCIPPSSYTAWLGRYLSIQQSLFYCPLCIEVLFEYVFFQRMLVTDFQSWYHHVFESHKAGFREGFRCFPPELKPFLSHFLALVCCLSRGVVLAGLMLLY